MAEKCCNINNPQAAGIFIVLFLNVKSMLDGFKKDSLFTFFYRFMIHTKGFFLWEK